MRDEVLHLQCDEVMTCEPDEVGRGDDGGSECPVPEPPGTKVMALRWQDDKGGEEADDRKGYGVFRENADADAGSDANPVSFVAGAEKASREVDDEGPSEQV